MKALRWSSLIAGILLVVLGCISFFTLDSNLVAIAMLVCLLVLFYGILMIASYFSYSKEHRSGWLLVLGILSALLGLWMLLSGDFVAIIATIPFVFALWLLFGSISMIASSFDMKNMNVSGWVLELILGIIGSVLGFFLLFNPLTSAVSASLSLAFIFVFRGISDIIFFFTTRKIDS